MADIAARAFGRGETPAQIREYLQGIVTYDQLGLIDRAIGDAERSIQFNKAMEAGNLVKANQLLAAIREAGGAEPTVQAKFSVYPPGYQPGAPTAPVSDSAVRIPVPAGATAEDVAALVQAAADVAAAGGAGADSTPGGSASDVVFIGLYAQ
jgi:hypothetical protein